MQGFVEESGLGQLAFGDVRLRAGHSIGRSLVRAEGEAAAQHPSVVSVPVADAVLFLEMGGATPKVGVDGLHHRLPVVRVDAVEPFRGPGAELGLGVAQHLTPAGGKAHLIRAQIPVPEAVVGGFRSQGVPLFALSQGPAEAVDPQSVADGPGQEAAIDLGLHQVVHRPLRQSFHRLGDRIQLAEDDQGRAGGAFHDLGDGLSLIRLHQGEVKQDHVVAFLLEPAQAFLQACLFPDLEGEIRPGHELLADEVGLSTVFFDEEKSRGALGDR